MYQFKDITPDGEELHILCEKCEEDGAYLYILHVDCIDGTHEERHIYCPACEHYRKMVKA